MSNQMHDARMRPQLSLRDLGVFMIALASAAWYISLWQGALGSSLWSLMFLGWSAATIASPICCIYLMITRRERAACWILMGWFAAIVVVIAVIVVATLL
jgi:hypothetical protein